MAFRKQRSIFLATCLLESIEDENYRNTRKLLVEYNADPNLLIPTRNIAAIHYAAGMENTNFAEAAMKLILKHNGNPNIKTIDGETPLHIAVIWNRSLIVEMLLDHGADPSITDNDNNTPINHAISERHYDLIHIFQNNIFEKKLQTRNDLELPSDKNDRTLNKTLDTVVKSLQNLDIIDQNNSDKILTPNRRNFNFKEASPFLVNINCRRPKYRQFETSKLENICNKPNLARQAGEDVIVISSDSDSEVNNDDKDHKMLTNLFELTQENIEKHLSMMVKKNRKHSLINLWRNKVNESRYRRSMIPIDETEFETILSEYTEENEESIDTIVPAKQFDRQETEDSFITAAEENGIFDTIVQTQEFYEYFDAESNVVFYENKLIANPEKMAGEKIDEIGDIIINTSSESGTCAVPTDYDTDDLRKELKAFGDVPGPINKGTKRLYLKRLVRYKRRPQQNQTQGLKCNFSVELQKTMRDDINMVKMMKEYAVLERKMIDNFQTISSKNMREGYFKKSFIYLLIDPRIAENLLAESQIISSSQLWTRFLRSIFYVGKGKSSRPYAHLYDAIKIYNDETARTDKMTKYQESVKLDRIIDIWRSNKGVICLPVFHNITPVEAYTREAAIIDSIGVQNLTNIKRGDYYGIAKSWTMRDRKRLGVSLLHKAMQVFMIEGESQLRPKDIK